MSVRGNKTRCPVIIGIVSAIYRIHCMKILLKTRKGKIVVFSAIWILLSLGIVACSESQHNASQEEITPMEPLMDISSSLKKLQEGFDLNGDDPTIIVSIVEQKLLLVKNREIVKSYPISSSAYGVGNKAGSNKTPLGTHSISHKIGDGAEIGTVFRSRANTRQIATIYTDKTDVEDDLVTTRIMWLQGMESGVNKGKGIDSHARYIYIHGTPEEGLIGAPASHGCIRMKNHDVVELFDAVRKGTLVEIQE